MHTRRNRVWPLALLASGCLLLSGCAEFDDSATGQTFGPSPELTPETGPSPQLPEIGGRSRTAPGGPSPSPTPIPPPQGCKDFDKAVIATCLDTVAAVAALPGDPTRPAALAGERRSGRVLQVAPDKDAVEITRLDVDAAGDGGLTGLALSPSYAEDQLVFAYVTTPSDNRVLRLVRGQQPKPVLTGIPRGRTGNRGALATDRRGALLVATGDAGDPAAAADPNSLAGKVLRIDTAGRPATGNPTAGSAVLAAGLHSPGGLCQAADASRTWVTDRAPAKDAIYRVQPGKPLTPAWTWPDKPGVAGCADGANILVVAATTAACTQNLPIAQDGSVSGKPAVALDGKNGTGYGMLAGMDVLDPQTAVVGTVNKDGGKPVSSDDRVVLIALNAKGGPGGGRD